MKIFCLLLTLSLAVDAQENAGPMVTNQEQFLSEIFIIIICSRQHQMASVLTPV
jgi:hypothetical protein